MPSSFQARSVWFFKFSANHFLFLIARREQPLSLGMRYIHHSVTFFLAHLLLDREKWNGTKYAGTVLTRRRYPIIAGAESYWYQS